MDKVIILLLLTAIACGSPSQRTDESGTPDTYTPPSHHEEEWPDVGTINEPSSSHESSTIISGDFSDLTAEEQSQISDKQIGDHLIADRILIYNPLTNDLYASLGIKKMPLNPVRLNGGQNWMSERFAPGARPIIQFAAMDNKILQYDLKLASQYCICWCDNYGCWGLKEVAKKK